MLSPSRGISYLQTIATPFLILLRDLIFCLLGLRNPGPLFFSQSPAVPLGMHLSWCLQIWIYLCFKSKCTHTAGATLNEFLPLCPRRISHEPRLNHITEMKGKWRKQAVNLHELVLPPVVINSPWTSWDRNSGVSSNVTLDVDHGQPATILLLIILKLRYNLIFGSMTYNSNLKESPPPF